MQHTTLFAAITLFSAGTLANDFALNCSHQYEQCMYQATVGPCSEGSSDAPCTIRHLMTRNHRGHLMPACRVYQRNGVAITTWFCGSWDGCAGGAEELDEEYGVCRSEVEVGQTVCLMRDTDGTTTHVAGKNFSASRRLVAGGAKGEVQSAMVTDDGMCLFFPEPQDPVEKQRSRYALYTFTIDSELTQDTAVWGVRIADKTKQPWLIDAEAVQLAKTPEGKDQLVKSVDPYEITRSTQDDEGDGNTHSTWIMFELGGHDLGRTEIRACHGCAMGTGVTDL